MVAVKHRILGRAHAAGGGLQEADLAGPSFRSSRGMAWHITTAASGVAATSILPVEVFTKSAPANIDSSDALRISSGF